MAQNMHILVMNSKTWIHLFPTWTIGRKKALFLVLTDVFMHFILLQFMKTCLWINSSFAIIQQAKQMVGTFITFKQWTLHFIESGSIMKTYIFTHFQLRLKNLRKKMQTRQYLKKPTQNTCSWKTKQKNRTQIHILVNFQKTCVQSVCYLVQTLVQKQQGMGTKGGSTKPGLTQTRAENLWDLINGRSITSTKMAAVSWTATRLRTCAKEKGRRWQSAAGLGAKTVRSGQHSRANDHADLTRGWLLGLGFLFQEWHFALHPVLEHKQLNTEQAKQAKTTRRAMFKHSIICNTYETSLYSSKLHNSPWHYF